MEAVLAALDVARDNGSKRLPSKSSCCPMDLDRTYWMASARKSLMMRHGLSLGDSQPVRAYRGFTSTGDLFEEALNARQADIFRQSPSCYSGYMAPKDLSVLEDSAARQAFHNAVAGQLGCPVDEVAVQVFKRLRPDTQTGEEVDLYQVSVHHNRPPEIVDCVQASELVQRKSCVP